ncbi:exopolysaccharide production negative regulator [Perilla frutescens var. hirtella]|uniref:Exopolysaccharide production negative regulator n=1 Tax=Perilla frutescens var. hirtella TaxID=608512 RepID=A0AAD4J051_PERFH|nr:exopolysaccharide production negative regulator [Perilla frutescens var. frutescens]KAH6784758.1 exopolysaccharide production negative regulator [Perilla frutescens var. hirtella]KAH6824464.1 exopolysaccharide production negative regulator [Perilla frutescens var. hirtella]
MDSPETNGEDLRDFNDDGTSLRRSLFRSFFAVALTFVIVLLLSFSVLYLAVLIGNLSIWSPIAVQSRCRIVSSSVDLRSSKVCELGLLNYKAKHVFYPFERKKYRCHYDYYWASVFEVEYIDHSGQARSAFAEAPNEALPDNCRPSFGAAWLTKDKFKVNETYECWYSLGISKVDINNEGLFNCQAEDPSTVEMLKRYSILFTRLLKSWFSSWGSVYLWRWDLIAGALSGFLMSLLSVTLIGVFYPLIAIIRRLFASWTYASHPSSASHRRIAEGTRFSSSAIDKYGTCISKA